jgi:hypothetical protein
MDTHPRSNHDLVSWNTPDSPEMSTMTTRSPEGLQQLAGADGSAGQADPPTHRARRIGRPRGPLRVALNVRILAAHNERLTSEVERQGLSPQYIIERALSEYFDRLDQELER